MRKVFIFIILLFSSISLSACGPSIFSINTIFDKENIIEEKYGDLEYVFVWIDIHKNLVHLFEDLEGVSYILENRGDRGSIDPDHHENWILSIDVVKQEGEYKLIVYNNVMKRFADKNKMYVMIDYILPVTIEEVIALTNQYTPEQKLVDFRISMYKEYKNIEDKKDHYEYTWLYPNPITDSFFEDNKAEVIISFYDSVTKNVLVSSFNKTLYGNHEEEEIYFPEDINYQEIISDVK